MGDEESAHLLEEILRNPDEDPTDLPLSFFKAITNNFSKELKVGEGGFGEVYKGKLSNGEVVAVKKLVIDGYRNIDDKSFENEVCCEMRCNHKNIVRFLGFCSDTQRKAVPVEGRYVLADVRERVLCFEFIRCGSLRSHISDESNGLGWDERYGIIKGVCQGLRYLHEEKKIVHLDLKPENILMDKNMVPKISDFGLSRLFDEKQTRSAITSKNPGTLGYMAPEYLHEGRFSYKADIYSLGAIILEVMTGERNEDSIDNVLENWKNRLQTISCIRPLEAYCNQVKRCLEIALDCKHIDRHRRPTIGQIINILDETETGYQENKTVTSTELLEIQHHLELRFPFKVISTENFGKMVSMDVHPTKPWVVTSHYNGRVCIWDYETKELVNSFPVTKEHEVMPVKFIARKQWIVAGCGDFCIHVYNYNEMKIVKKFKAHNEKITSLAIHPTKPYILSASYDWEIKLWDWENGWTPEIYEEHSGSVRQVAFNATDAKVFGSVSQDKRLKVWTVNSPGSRPVTLTHTSDLRCLDYFSRGGKQYMITGSDDCSTAQIWDLQEKRCVETLKGHENRVTAVCCHPELPVLVTGSRDDTVRLWNTGTFRPERERNCGLKKVHALACMKGSNRIVVGYSNGLAITEIVRQGCSNALAA